MYLQGQGQRMYFIKVKVTQNVVQYPLHHVIYLPPKFEVATLNG